MQIIAKTLYFFSSIAILSATLFQSVAKAQEYPGCFTINSSGKVSNLNPLCRRNQEQIRIIMNAQQFYQQGRDKGRSGLYKEAFADFNQAINHEPDCVKVYILRAHARNLMEDKVGAIADFQRAMNIYRSRGQLTIADFLLVPIQTLQNEINMSEQQSSSY